ncbi:hypothetical protein JNW91_06010 [Micromonospora sp. STR1_7]|uniref:Uncharacterized protein n=1 Tax=Micromonospora parastrephiae TaxID=2806101 RepID=A0ABS1XQC3_9ACTN|nr:hypothetical protein [Micromonospora parastrephiae]MBM0231455.1 hypothetical protein [Micromonospora parastrephiae]
MITKPSPGMWASMMAPVGTVLADAPWWMFVGTVLLALTHRILPRESKDLLNLWLRIISRQQGPKDKQGKGRET